MKCSPFSNSHHAKHNIHPCYPYNLFAILTTCLLFVHNSLACLYDSKTSTPFSILLVPNCATTQSQKRLSITIPGTPQSIRSVSKCIIEPTRKLAFHNRQRGVLPDLLDPVRALQESALYSWIILHGKLSVSFFENSIDDYMLNVSYIRMEDDGSHGIVPS